MQRCSQRISLVFLRLCHYAMLAADASNLGRACAHGLPRNLLASLGVPIEARFQAVKAMKEVVSKRVGR